SANQAVAEGPKRGPTQSPAYSLVPLDPAAPDSAKMGVWSYDFVEAQTHDEPQAQAHDVDRRVYSLSPFAMDTFYGNRTTPGGPLTGVLIEPSLDDPCTALCIIDRAPKPRAADGKLSEVS